MQTDLATQSSAAARPHSRRGVGRSPFHGGGYIAVNRTRPVRLYSAFDYATASIARVGHPAARDMKAFAYVILAAEAAGNFYGITPEELFSESRDSAPISRARQIAMTISVVCGGFEQTKVGRVFDRDRTTVWHAVRLVETWRVENDAFDREVEMLENSVIDHWTIAGDADGTPRGLADRLARLM